MPVPSVVNLLGYQGRVYPVIQGRRRAVLGRARVGPGTDGSGSTTIGTQPTPLLTDKTDQGNPSGYAGDPGPGINYAVGPGFIYGKYPNQPQPEEIEEALPAPRPARPAPAHRRGGAFGRQLPPRKDPIMAKKSRLTRLLEKLTKRRRRKKKKGSRRRRRRLSHAPPQDRQSRSRGAPAGARGAFRSPR